MKKRGGFILFSLIAAIVACVSLFPVTAFAFAPSNGVSSRVSDKYDRLSDSDEARIYSAIVEAENTVSAVFLVAVFDTNKNIPSGKDILASFGFDHRYDSVVLLVIKYNPTGGENKHKYEMFTYGEPHKAISNREANDILDSDAVYNNLKSGRFADGAVAFIRGSADAIEAEESSGDNDLILGICFGAFALIIGLALPLSNLIGNKISNLIGKNSPASNQIPSKNKKNYDNNSSRGSRGYGSGYGSGGGFGGSTGGSRGGR